MKVLSGLVGIGAMAAAVLPFSLGAYADSVYTAGDWRAPPHVDYPDGSGGWKTIGGVIVYGQIEAGGIGFIDRPQNQIRATTIPVVAGTPITGSPVPGSWAYTQHESRAKFEEYGNLNPGFWFDHIFFNAVTTDYSRYADFYGSHIGNNDQYFRLQLGETGKQYLTLEWDQIPHLYSTTAQSLYGGSKTFLTAPDLSASCPSTGPATAAAATVCATAIQANLHTINLGIQRDKGTVVYRSTPDDKSEFKVEYSHERRWGNIETGVTSGTTTGGIGTGGTAMQVPMPIADTTQDARASYQYTGTSPWGMRFTGSAQYAVSIFRNDLTSFDVQNPFIHFNGVGSGNATPGYLNQASLYPDNMAQSFTGTVGADLPAKSRYMGTFSYTMMRQNDPFMAQTSSANIFSFGGAIVPAATIPPPSRGSLDGSVNTMLFNNVLTTQITPELKNKLSYRYYDYDNRTSPLLMQQWVVGDTANACSASASYCPHVTQFSSNTKQTAGDELTWRASNMLTTGLGYGWERIDYTLANAKATNENSGKIFADAKAADWLTVRTSYLYAVRNSDNYNYLANVWGPITNGSGNPAANCAVPSTTAAVGTCAGTGGIEINPLMRVFMLADRVRQKGNVYIDFETMPGIVITPTIGLKLDRYNDPANTLMVPGKGTANTIGLKQDNDINLGVDLTAQLTGSTKLITSYMYEAINRTFLWATGNTTAASNLANYDRVSSNDFVHTISAKLAIDLKPQVLDLVLGYSISRALETGGGVTCAGTVAQCSSGASLALANSVPNATNTYQLFDAVLKYKFNQDQMRAAGWMGQGYMKLRYVYETNHVSNWQSDSMMPYMYAVAPSATGGGNKVWMAGDNPNYSAQLIMATLGLTW
jgi:MtrB/PioB family decaheme-associated outer membrane protein